MWNDCMGMCVMIGRMCAMIVGDVCDDCGGCVCVMIVGDVCV